MEQDIIKYWLALNFVSDVGTVTFKNLINAFGSPQNVFQASINALKKVPRVSEKIAIQIKEFNDWSKIDQELELTDKSNVSIITSSDTLYPKNLLNIYDYPPLLYIKGSLTGDDVNIAVVGSRVAST